MEKQTKEQRKEYTAQKSKGYGKLLVGAKLGSVLPKTKTQNKERDNPREIKEGIGKPTSDLPSPSKKGAKTQKKDLERKTVFLIRDVGG